jgi:hypothetical protein
MDAESISSATVATAKSINKAVESIELTNNTNGTTHLKILNLEKCLIQQNQTTNEILNHLRKQKNSKGSQQAGTTSGEDTVLSDVEYTPELKGIQSIEPAKVCIHQDSLNSLSTSDQDCVK